jgi:class 3 adenylate cyclase
MSALTEAPVEQHRHGGRTARYQIPSTLSFSSDITALPARLRWAIREQQADAEILIAWIQLAIVLLFSVLYAAAPKAFPETSWFEPVPWVVGAYIAITLSQLGLAHLRRLTGILLGGFVVADVVLLFVLIWSFHIQYIRAGRGEACEGAILIFDIRSFTALSDHLAPDEVMAPLAEYQARLIPIIQNHGGSIDKFLGDGVIATFGVARPSPAYAADAIVVLDEALAAIDRWNAARHTAGLDAVAVNAALTIGPVIFGAVGNDTRLEYTVIGEPVNLAAKLDKHNKKSGTRALATQDAFAMALVQGYCPKTPRETRRACLVDGADAPVDLVVLA